MILCDECDGSGKKKCTTCLGSGISLDVLCPMCSDCFNGKVPCKKCNGTGKVDEKVKSV